jgi:uncharacterized delta-60 repeat protein
MKRRIGLMALSAALLALSSSSLVAQELWLYRYNGPANWDDRAGPCVMGSDGNLYAGGMSMGVGTNDDFTVVSLTSSGEERWVYRYVGDDNHEDEVYSLIMGLDGNIYAAGESHGAGTYQDITVVSLTSSGVERWVYTYDGSGNWWDWASSIVMGSDSNLYVAGQSLGSDTCNDFTVISLTTRGAQRWVYRYDGSVDSSAAAQSIIMGSDGNLYAAGGSEGIGTDWDFAVISLTTSGAERWVYRYNGPADSTDGAKSIIMGSDGNLYAAGWSEGSETDCDFMVVSLTTSGEERWVYRYNGPGNGDDGAGSIAMGADGNIYVAGSSSGSGTGGDFTVLSLDTSGIERWVYRYIGLQDGWDAATSIVVGPDGNIYAAGYSQVVYTSRDFTVISLTPSGAERWVYEYDGPGPDGLDEAFSIVVGSDGKLYVAGSSFQSLTYRDFFIVSLDPGVGVEEKDRRAIRPPVLEMSVSPVPTSSVLRIDYSLPEATEVKLSIYDVSGRLVRNLVNGREESGSKVVQWDGANLDERRVASGTYFIRLEAAGSCISRKFILF